MKRIRLLTALPLFLLLSFTPAGFAQEQSQDPSQDQSQYPSQDQQQQTPPSDPQQTPPSDPQQTPPSDPQQMPQHDTTQMQLEQSITGELKSVDTDAKKIVVTTTDGTDMEFLYNDQTECGGGEESIEGLSTSAGSQVTVHYREENQEKLATKIEVESASQTDETPQVTPQQQPDTDTPPSTPDMQEPNPPDANRPPSNPEQPLPESQQQPE